MIDCIHLIEEFHAKILVEDVSIATEVLKINRYCTISIGYMAETLGISANTYTNWKNGITDKRKGAKHANNCRYSEADREIAIKALKLNPDKSESHYL